MRRGSSDGASKPAAASSRRSGPVDPRLLHYARGTRRYLLLTVVLGGVTAGLVLAQAWLIANTISDVVVHHRGLAHVRTLVVLLAVVICGRSLVAWLGERAAQRASASAKSDLRTALVERIVQLGPAGIDRERSGRLVVLATSGIDALDSYFARYLPQLFLAVIVPVTVIVVVLGADWISAVIIAVTVPLIPLFMALVGASTKVRMRRQARLLQRLAGHFLDVVAGLPTLKVFGRAKAQVAAVRDITDRYRTATMATLKVAFLSSLILELLATFSVALVAVAVGLRLLGGHVSFATALFVLILAPEAYLPLRLLGTNYHASAEGMKAAEDVFEVLERPVPTRGLPSRRPRPVHLRAADRTARGPLPGPHAPGAARRLPLGRARRSGGHRRSERLWQVQPSRRPPRPGSRLARLGQRRRGRSGRPRPRCLADPGGLGAAATPPLRPLHRRQRAARPARRHRRRGAVCHRRRRARRGGGRTARGTRDHAGHRRCGAVGGGAAAGGPGPGLPPGRTPPPPRRAHGESRRPDRGGRVVRRAAADGRSHGGDGGPPTLPAGPGRPCGPTGTACRGAVAS